MNRQWMYGDRHTFEYIKGVHDFLEVAEANKQNGFMCCPCPIYGNTKSYSDRKIRRNIFSQFWKITKIWKIRNYQESHPGGHKTPGCAPRWVVPTSGTFPTPFFVRFACLPR